MSGTTRSAQQPLDTPSFVVVLAGAVIVLAATLAIAWGTTNLGKMTQNAAPAPAPLTAPAIRDLGSRDLDSAPTMPLQGAPGAYRGNANATSAGHAGLRAQ
jgi:hypothetical protein